MHIPKTAGSSVRQLLRKYQSNRPETPEEWHENMINTKGRMNEDVFNKMFKFTFVRNPWDRLYSTYQFICNKPLSKIENIPQHHYKEIGFKRWLIEEEFFTPNHIPPTPEMVPVQRRTMYDWTHDDAGNCLVDFVGRFETVVADFNHICSTIGVGTTSLPHTQVSKRKKDYRQAYDDEAVAFVEHHHQKDITTFNYTFE